MYYLITGGFFYFLIVSLNLFDFMPSSFLVDTRIVQGHQITRYNLGFGSANGAFIFFLPILTSALYLTKAKKNLLIVFPLLIIAVSLIYYFTLSRTGIITSLFLFLMLILPGKEKLLSSKILKGILKNVVLVFILISIAIAVFLSLTFINELLAFRPGYWLIHILQGVYHYNLFGYPWNEHYQSLVTKIPLDNSYIGMILAKGLVFSFLIFAYYYKGMAVLLSNKELVSIIIILSIFIFGLFENTFFVVGFNISLFIIYHSINLDYDKKQKFNSKEDTLLLAK